MHDFPGSSFPISTPYAALPMTLLGPILVWGQQNYKIAEQRDIV